MFLGPINAMLRLHSPRGFKGERPRWGSARTPWCSLGLLQPTRPWGAQLGLRGLGACL